MTGVASCNVLHEQLRHPCRRAGLDREHRSQHAGGDRRFRGAAAGGGAFGPQQHRLAAATSPGRAGPRRIVVADPAAAARQDWSALPAGVELLRRARGGRPAGRRPGGGHRGFGHRRQRRPAGHLGRLGGRQDRGPGQQGEPGGRRPAGDASWPDEKTPESSPSTANTAPCFRPCRRGGGRRCGG